MVEEADASWVHRFASSVCRSVLFRVWRLEVLGWEHMPAQGRVIVAFNHRSLADAILVPVLNGRRVAHALGKEELFRNPIAGWFFRTMKVIPLDRSRADFGSLRSAIAVLNGDGCIVMAPEGTRSKTGAPGRPKAGISFLAQQSGSPVVPCRLTNTEKFPALVPIRVHFGPMLRYRGDGSRESYQKFADRVMEEISKL